MAYADWLQTLAEIGLGFAGFSALIAGMRRQDEMPDPENSNRGRAVVETSLSVLFGCTVPVLLIGLGFTETAAFRIAGGVFLLIGAPLSVRGFHRAITTRNRENSMQPVLSILGLFAGVAGLGFSLACALGRPEAFVPTYYFGALIGILGISAVNFAGFVFAINNDQVEDID